MDKIDVIIKKINLRGRVEYQKPLAPLTTFQVGGPAEAFVTPADLQEAARIFQIARQEGLPFFALGRGANLLVSDKGIPGLVLNMAALNRTDLLVQTGSAVLRCEAGADVSAAVEFAFDRGFSSLEFLNGMPSTIGGAVWMNARCYGAEIADVLIKVTCADADGKIFDVPFNPAEWDYKISPFQNQDWLILSADFKAKAASRTAIKAVMEANVQDRRAKGHFRAPCAGSVFKNNRAYGDPSGVIIDRCGLKGLQIGGARVSDWHANIIINTGTATAADIRNLTLEVKDRVLKQTGFLLEEEVLYAGAW